MRTIWFIIAFAIHCLAFSSFGTPADSLAGKNFEYLRNGVTHAKHSASAPVYAHAWLKKSKAENNLQQQLLAYQALMHVSPAEIRFQYADSLLATANIIGDNISVGSAYLTIGAAFNHNKEYLKALDYYLLADKYIVQTTDLYLAHKVKYAIGNIKYYLGYFEEAIALLKECAEYYQEENDVAYLKSLHSIGLCYMGIERFDMCSQYNQFGLHSSLDLENLEMASYFTHSEGVNQYFKKNYRKSVELLNESLLSIQKKKDFANVTVAWFYIGKSFKSLGKENKAISYFRKVDEAITQYDYIRPDLRENYELLLNYYENKGIKDSVDYYGRRLMNVDKKLSTDYKYLIGKVFKEYDTNEFLRTQQRMEDKRKKENFFYALLITSLISFSVFQIIRHRRNQKLYRKKFLELMNGQMQIPTAPPDSDAGSDIIINPEIVATVLKRLKKFEKKKIFIGKDMSLTRVADYLETNQKYASQIIWRYRGRRFPDYISDLKISYIVELLKTDKKFRKYKNESLAKEVGFGSTQNFTRAFKERTGISPTYFIEHLHKGSDNDLTN